MVKPATIAAGTTRRVGVAPDGRVFMLNGFKRDLNYLDVSDGSIERTGYLPGGMDWDHRLGGVMFEESKILAFANARSAMIIDISEEASLDTIENVGDLEKKRVWGDTTVLADGKVLISGGGELDENQGQASADRRHNLYGNLGSQNKNVY